MKEPSEATKYRRNSTFPSSRDIKVNSKHKALFPKLIDLLKSQDADIDPESLLLPLSRRRRSRRVSTVDGLRLDGGGGGLLLSENISTDISLQVPGAIWQEGRTRSCLEVTCLEGVLCCLQVSEVESLETLLMRSCDLVTM